MTKLMDKFFVRIGLDKSEIEASDIRGILYVGMVFMTGWTIAFLIMTALS